MNDSAHSRIPLTEVQNDSSKDVENESNKQGKRPESPPIAIPGRKQTADFWDDSEATLDSGGDSCSVGSAPNSYPCLDSKKLGCLVLHRRRRRSKSISYPVRFSQWDQIVEYHPRDPPSFKQWLTEQQAALLEQKASGLKTGRPATAIGIGQSKENKRKPGWIMWMPGVGDLATLEQFNVTSTKN